MAEASYAYKLLVIQDSVLSGLARSDAICNELPFLRGLRQVERASGGGCGSCGGGGAPRVRADAFQAAKAAIANLPAAKKIRLKQLTRAKQIRVIWKRPGDGRTVELTF